MGFVSDVLEKVDDCAELYNFLFVDYQIGKINEEMAYLERINNDPKQIRYFFLGCANQMGMPLKVWYIQTIMNYSDEELRKELEKMYQILLIRKNQIMQNKINTEPIKFVSNTCKTVEEIVNYTEILTTIKHMESTYERTPSSYVKMQEEDLRNTLLAALNGTYLGGAVGEAFRNNGKTDICIEEKIELLL